MSTMIGQTVAHYRITEQLGCGGMGIIYKAIDLRLNRPTALKFLPIHLTADKDIRQRFIQEAQATAALNHAHIVTIYEINEWQGQTYIAMEYIAGQALNELLDRGTAPEMHAGDGPEVARPEGSAAPAAAATQNFKPLPIRDIIHITLQVAAGLQAAHDAGIIHRDVKPANVIITRSGTAKLIDFGLAKLAGQAKLTQAGSTMGTAPYMSPEQAEGKTVDRRSDIWSLGVMLYEMTTGQMAFSGESIQAVLQAIIHDEPQRLERLRPDAPRALERIISRCLEKKPNCRYQQTRELIADLQRLETATGEHTARIPALAGRAGRLLKKNLLTIAALAAAAGLLLATPYLLKWLTQRPRQSLVPAQKYLAVLPLLVIDADRPSQAFSDGLVETLTSKLTQFEQDERSLWIVPASELRASGIDSPSRARKALGVNLVITGSLQQSGGVMRLTMNLVDTQALRQIHSAVITEKIAASADFQDRAVDEVARMLELELPLATRTRLAAGGTSLAAANEYYLQGRGFLQRYEQQENLDTAIGLFRKAIAADPGFALAFAGMGEAFWRKYELTKDTQLVLEAQDNCRQAITLNSNLVPVYITMGIIERGSGRYPEAVINLKKALELDPVNSEALLGLALVYRKQGKLAEAESTYRQAIHLKPNYWAAVNSLGFFYAINGRWQEAETMFLQVIALTPDNIRGYNNLGSVYQFQEKTALAQAMYEKSLAIRANPDAYSNLGTIYFFAGRYHQAAAMYEKGISLGINDCQIWGNLGDAYSRLPEFKDKSRSAYQNAIRLADTQLRINPRDAQLRSSLALYYAKAGQPQNSLDEITQARELAANNVTVLINAALVYELALQRKHALSALAKFFTLSGPKQMVDQEPLFSDLRQDPGYAALFANKKLISNKKK